VQYISTNY